ncbi:MotA/TolQ/ExbB proton channel family protein [Rhodanobacter lindaniclasticus]
MFLQTPAATSNTNAEAMKQMGFENLMQNFDWLGWVVFVTLVAMSFLSWYFIIANGIRNATVKARADKVIDGFWGNGSTQDAIRELEAQPKGEPFSKIALEAASAMAHHQQSTTGTTGRLAESLSRSEFIDRALRQAVARESMKLEGGMTLLATVGSAAPFVGLLGTVWGIYHALIGIAATGNASMNAVAGPVGEALIMTAFGLFAAIPALFAYNFFNRSNRVVYARFDEFANDLHDFFATGSRIESAK